MKSFASSFCRTGSVFASIFLSQFIAWHLPGAPALQSGFSQTMIANGISSPTAMEFAPDGRLFVCEQGGALRVIKNMALLATPFVTVSTTSFGERGLLGIAFDPGFHTNQFLYLYYTSTSGSTHNRVSRFTASGDVAVPGSEVPILDLENLAASNHNGGAIHFGIDGMLYIAVGENAVTSNAQTLANRLGKVLRINRDGSIPTDNPFYNTATGVNRSIWALGLRNPYTFAVQPGTGRIFINDVGNQTWEEINVGAAGANYGWPNCEGRCASPNPSYRDPIFQYSHGAGATNGCDITGGAFYNPIAFQYPAAYHGTYFFADACGGWIRRLNPITGSVSNFATGLPAPVDVKVGAEGRLYYLGRSGGQVWVVDYTNAPPTLGIARESGSSVIVWPAPSTGYALQSASTLPASGGWNPVNGVVTMNGQRRFTIVSGSGTQFYRLVKP